jgi:hypothetical protein
VRKIRVGLLVDGQFRRLLSLAEKRNELTIGIANAEHFSFTPGETKVLQQKYTVHASPNSPVYNTITHTLRLSNGERLRSYILTDAVKGKSGFSHLFSRRCPDLRNERYLLRDASAFDPIILGDYSPQRMTPLLSVFVGGPSNDFDATSPDFFVRQIQLPSFRVVVAIAMCVLPSHWTGDLAHSNTFKPEDFPPEVQDMMWGLLKGISPASCLEKATTINKALIGRYIGLVLRTAKELGVDNRVFLARWAEANGITISDSDGTGETSLLIEPPGLDQPPSATPV